MEIVKRKVAKTDEFDRLRKRNRIGYRELGIFADEEAFDNKNAQEMKRVDSRIPRSSNIGEAAVKKEFVSVSPFESSKAEKVIMPIRKA